MRFFISLLIALSAVTSARAAAGLVAHLPFNGDLLDTTTNHNGASIAAPAFDTGVEGDALVVNSATAAVSLSNPKTLDFGNDFTVSAWVKTTYPGEQVVIYRGDPAHFTGAALQINVQGPKFFIYGDSQGSFGADFTTTHGISVNDGEWHQIAVSYRASAAPHLTFYLDGHSKTTGDLGTYFAGDFVTQPNKTNSVVRIGGRDTESAAYHFNGLIDDVQIYNRTLNTNQVALLFTTPGSALPAPIVPEIIVQPAPLQSAAAGSSVSFSVQAEAQSPLSYQWQLNGTKVIGATNASLAITNVSSAQSGTYTVVVTSLGGTVTSAPANLVVGGAPEVSILMYPGITIKGTAGLKYRLDYEAAIGPANNWTALTNVILTTNQALFIDLSATNSAKRIYRAVLTP